MKNLFYSLVFVLVSLVFTLDLFDSHIGDFGYVASSFFGFCFFVVGIIRK